MRLRADRELVSLAFADEDEPRCVGVVFETGLSGPGGDHGARRLRVRRRLERQLEVPWPVLVADRSEHADDVPVAKRHPAGDTRELTAAPHECPVDAAAVDDPPGTARVFEGAVLRTRDEVLRVSLERNVVHLGQAADRHALTGQRNRRRLGAIGTRNDHPHVHDSAL